MTVPIPISATPIVAIVVQELPVNTEITAQIAQAVNRNSDGLSTFRPQSISTGTTPLSIQVADTVPIRSNMGIEGIIWLPLLRSPTHRFPNGQRQTIIAVAAATIPVPSSSQGL